MTNPNSAQTPTTTTTMQVRDCFFLHKPCLHAHLHFLLTQQPAYLAALQTICDKGVIATLSSPTKARILAALHMTGNTKLVEPFMTKHCNVVDVTKAVVILDRPRYIQQLERKIEAILQAHPRLREEEEAAAAAAAALHVGTTRHRKKHHRSRRTQEEKDEGSEQQKKRRKRQIDVYRAELKAAREFLKESHESHLPCSVLHDANTAVPELMTSASLSGSLSKKIRRWARTHKSDLLEFNVLSESFESWRTLADLVHFKPSDFTLPYFLSAVHGGELPNDSFVKGLRDILNEANEVDMKDQFAALASRHPQIYQSFNFLRMHPKLLQDADIASLLAKHIPLSTAIWYLEELAQSSNKWVPRIVAERMKEDKKWIKENSKVTESFGKLLERLLTCQQRGWTSVADLLMPAAEIRLSALKEKWDTGEEENREGLTVIFGDKSASMQSAIQAATIIAAMISTCFKGELSFFDGHPRPSPFARPSTVRDVLKICTTVRANSMTSMAAALWPYYARKTKIRRIILVSDEGENTRFAGHLFAELLAKYKAEVHRDVEFISICVDQGDEEFRNSLDEHSISYKRMEIDGSRPDLSKFDSLLGQIAMLSFSPQVEEVVATIDADMGGDALPMVENGVGIIGNEEDQWQLL